MRILENHFDGKTTIVTEGRIINGCQDFIIEGLDRVCFEYRVSDKEKQQVRDLYALDQRDPLDPMEFVSHEDWQVREAIAMYGDDSHRDNLVRDPTRGVRLAVARYGNDSHRDTLLDDPSWRVREAAQK